MLALRRGSRRLDLTAQPVRDQALPNVTDVLAGGTTSRSCRRTPRVSPLVPFGATLGSPPGQPKLRTSCPTSTFHPGHSARVSPPYPPIRPLCRSTIHPSNSNLSS